MDSRTAKSMLELAEQASAGATGPNAKISLERLDEQSDRVSGLPGGDDHESSGAAPDSMLPHRASAAVTPGYDIAQLNVGRIVAPIDHARLADFVGWLDEINALAERSPGFVWRLQGDNGNNTSLHVSADPLFIVNLSVWESVEQLQAFTYASGHKAVFARRFDWFERREGPNHVMWWQPKGAIPDVMDALRRLERLADLGPTTDGFTFKEPFPPPALAVTDA